MIGRLCNRYVLDVIEIHYISVGKPLGCLTVSATPLPLAISLSQPAHHPQLHRRRLLWLLICALGIGCGGAGLVLAVHGQREAALWGGGGLGLATAAAPHTALWGCGRRGVCIWAHTEEHCTQFVEYTHWLLASAAATAAAAVICLSAALIA